MVTVYGVCLRGREKSPTDFVCLNHIEVKSNPLTSNRCTDPGVTRIERHRTEFGSGNLRSTS